LDPPGLTVTATGNLDSDRSIDQWHVNDITDIEAWPLKPDMDDMNR
jgi:hypothetical protein